MASSIAEDVELSNDATLLNGAAGAGNGYHIAYDKSSKAAAQGTISRIRLDVKF
jgi:hypothetical protein